MQEEKVSLRNKNINKNGKVEYTVVSDYIDVFPDSKRLLFCLRNKLINILNSDKGIVINFATGFQAKITNQTKSKILYPAPKFNVYRNDYINNLNAACHLKILFEKAIYIDTLTPMKGKKIIVMS